MRKYSFIRFKPLLCTVIILLVLCYSGNGNASVVKVAILPFQMNADEDIEYINRGIRDMIASRITYGAHITVVEQDLVRDTLSKAVPGKLTKKKMLEIGSRLGVDYVIYGSITKIGNNVSIDTNVLNVLNGNIINPVFIQNTGLDELIPTVQNIAQGIKDLISVGLRDLPYEKNVQSAEALKTLLEEKPKVDELLLEKIKEEIKREILAELRRDEMAKTSGQPPTPDDRERLKEELTQDILVKLRKQNGEYGRLQSSENLGSAEGRILHNSKGLEGCRVKLVRVTRYGILTKIFQDYNLDTAFGAITDTHGKYHFDNLPAGSYKLKWELPGQKGWIRRLKDKPDVTIEKGKKGLLKDVETNRRLVPR